MGAEEIPGYPGSTHYVENLEEDDKLESVAVYLNFDMIAPPDQHRHHHEHGVTAPLPISA